MRPGTHSSLSPDGMFQFTHPRGVRRLRAGRLQVGTTFQFTHPRGVRHVASCGVKLLVGVSIHAPARGATGKSDRTGASEEVSIHAPARGATSRWSIERWRGWFQFTHPRGVRLSWSSVTMPHSEFQFTHPRGVRPAMSTILIPMSRFQFTHPRGVRQAQQSTILSLRDVSIHAPARGATLP